MPGVTHSATVTANATRTLRWPRDTGPSCFSSSRTICVLSAPMVTPRAPAKWNCTARNANITSITGTPITIHWKNVTSVPVSRSSMPMPIRFGGVPTGVPMPPIDAPNEVMSIITSANWRAPEAPVRARCAHDRQADRIHHRRRGGVAHPHREQHRDAAEHQQDARGAGADELPRQRGVGDAPIHAVDEHRLGQDEAADEDEDHRVGKRRERLAHRRDPQDDREHRAEHGGDRQRQRLGDPEHDHHRQDAGQAVRGRRERQRRGEQRDEEQRPQEQADGAAAVR